MGIALFLTSIALDSRPPPPFALVTVYAMHLDDRRSIHDLHTSSTKPS